MHDHNKDRGNKRMMWMAIPCLLLIGVLFFGGGKLPGNEYLWPILIGVFIVAHIWIIFRGHGKHGGADVEEKVDDAPTKQYGAKDEHKHGGCCH